MKPKQIRIVLSLLLIAFGLTACVHKLPLSSQKNTGMLVIAHEATLSPNGWPFVYGYIFSCSPAGGPEIKITTGTKNLFFFDNFPAGKYKLTAIELVPLNPNRAKALEDKKTYPLSNEYHFEIKPKQVTLLDNAFIVYNKDLNTNRFMQYYNLTKRLKKEDRKEIIQKLKKYENANSWIFPEP